MGFNQRAVLPLSIKAHVFTNLAWDNIDRLEETLTGKGTSHRVNGIAVQTKFYGPYPPRPELPRIDKLKQRSFNIEHEELEVYLACARVGPQPLPTNESHILEAQESLRSPVTRIWSGSLQDKTKSDCQTQTQVGLGLISKQGTKNQSQKMLLGICPPSMHQLQR
ncbi:hypothetical protein GWK47_008292 [Chionoecetes opilio]|uniref:Uncharacterized protein n=1 Tax=Chionoecetes opilio TaxID=41210 RepID=A0A8J4Y5B0_CHIOP|nr:hypothetical protein GWK47_008292 [Chionoecetes opilio]